MSDGLRWLLPPVGLSLLWFVLWWGLRAEHDVEHALTLAAGWLLVGVPVAYLRARRARAHG